MRKWRLSSKKCDQYYTDKKASHQSVWGGFLSMAQPEPWDLVQSLHSATHLWNYHGPSTLIFMNYSFLISKMKMFNCWVVSSIFLTLLFALVNPVFFKFLCYQIVCNSSLLSFFLMKGICKCLSEPLFCLRHPWYSVNKILAHNWKKGNFRLATLAIPDRLYNMDYEASWSSGVPMTWHCSGTSGLY